MMSKRLTGRAFADEPCQQDFLIELWLDYHCKMQKYENDIDLDLAHCGNSQCSLDTDGDSIRDSVFLPMTFFPGSLMTMSGN